MIIRYRWFRIHVPGEDRDLASIVATQPLTPKVSFGFSTAESVTGGPVYRFLWRTKVVVTEFDEDGTASYQEISSISFTDFSIVRIEDATFLRIENPGRNIRELLNALEGLVGLGFTSKAITFEKSRPTAVFENVESTKLVGLKVVGAVIDEDLVARMEFASKQGMLMDEMRILEGLHYKVDSASYELVYGGVRGQLAFSSGGTVKVSGALAPRLLHLIERDLVKL